MKTIELTNSDQVAIVDDWMRDTLLALGPWRGRNGYAEMSSTMRGVHCDMHKVVLEFAGHSLTGLTPDHRDRNKLNNTLQNLRPATHRQQGMNRRRESSNSSGFIGVVWDKHHQRWRSQVMVNGKNKYLGLFTDKVEAAKARDAAVLAGPDAEFAILNFPN